MRLKVLESIYQEMQIKQNKADIFLNQHWAKPYHSQ